MKWEYRELQATAMSVDYSGNNVLLAGRRWLAIKQISLEEDPGDIIKKYPRHSKYDAAGAEWCQTYQGQKLCAISVSLHQKYLYQFDPRPTKAFFFSLCRVTKELMCTNGATAMIWPALPHSVVTPES